MKVRVQFTINVNEDHWAEDFGLSSADAVRQDIKRWAWLLVTEDLRERGMLAGPGRKSKGV